MSDDVVLRLAVVAAVGAAAVIVALIGRRGVAVARRRVVLEGIGPGLILFTSTSCGTCAQMRARMGKWPQTVEVSYESAADAFPAGVDRVPAVALVDEQGRGWIAHGRVSEGRLARWIAGGP
ncbi:MAG TPA: hypothetical protein VMS74_11170 [Acidimicrobiia bacterium]|nr:hypothetical protein [Acidimicrobiia bacterium]